MTRKILSCLMNNSKTHTEQEKSTTLMMMTTEVIKVNLLGNYSNRPRFKRIINVKTMHKNFFLQIVSVKG